MVVTVNIKVLVSSYQFTGVNILLMLLSSAAAFLALWAVSHMYTTEFVGIFEQLFRWPETYLVMLFCTFAFILWDIGTVYTNIELRKWMLNRRLDTEALLKMKDKTDKTTVRTKISQPEDRGFAFSQEPGHDRLVTDNLNLMAIVTKSLRRTLD